MTNGHTVDCPNSLMEYRVDGLDLPKVIGLNTSVVSV